MAIATGYHGFLPYQNFAAVFKDLSRTGLDIRNRTSCGIFSVHHAMVFLGQGRNFRLLMCEHPRLLDKLIHGTVTDDLVRLAKCYRLKAAVFQSCSISQIRRQIDRNLAAGHAVIVGSEPNCHWICLGGRTESGGYVWADSSENPAVGAFDSWSELEHWMSASSEGGGLTYPFEIITVSPGAKMPASRSMVPWTGSIWKILSADPAYAKDWSNLLADMLEVFWDQGFAPKGRPAGDFFDEHLEAIVAAVTATTRHSRADLLEIGQGYRVVADFHSLVVPSGEETFVVAAFSLKLFMKAESR
jgi:hypothetical protein